MDGTAIVALIILCLFMAQGKHGSYQETAHPQKSGETIYTNLTEDKSDWQYQVVSQERMEAIIRKYNKYLSESEADRIKIATNLYCKEKDIDPRLILALMARESAFNPQAVSPSGAIGLGQIMPFNYQELGIDNPRDIHQNVKGLVYYFRKKLDEWHGESKQMELALASYLEGAGAIKRKNKKIEGHTEIYVNDILKIRGTI